MDLHSTHTDDANIITVNTTRIDASVAIQFKDAIKAITVDGPDRVVLDMHKVDFVDSSGLGAIVAAMKLLAPDKRLELSGLTPDVDKVFRLTRMDSVFSIHANVDAVREAG